MNKKIWAIIMADPWKKEFWSPVKSDRSPRFRSPNSQVFLPVAAGDVEDRKHKVVFIVLSLLIVLGCLAYGMYRRAANPADARLSYNSGVSLLHAGNYQAAILYLSRAISLKSGFYDAYLMRARAYAGVGRHDSAIADFTVFGESRPKDPTVLVERGAEQLARKDFPRAIADATAAIALNVKLASAYDLRATAIRAAGNARKAVDDYTMAVELQPNLDHYFQRAATYQLLGEHALAIADLDQAVDLSRNQPNMYFARAKSKTILGDRAGATQDIQLGQKSRVQGVP